MEYLQGLSNLEILAKTIVVVECLVRNDINRFRNTTKKNLFSDITYPMDQKFFQVISNVSE